jgi:hypothetical protein
LSASGEKRLLHKGEMHFLTSLSAIAILLHRTLAFKSITVGTSYNISAGSPIPITVINDADDAQAVNYTIGLYTTAGNFPICKLPPSPSLNP